MLEKARQTLLWQGVRSSFSANNLADELKTIADVAPSNPCCVTMPRITVSNPDMGPKDAFKYKEIKRDLTPFIEDQCIFALVAMVLLTGGEGRQAHKVTTMLNKMLMKKLHQGFYSHGGGNDTIIFIRSKMIEAIESVPATTLNMLTRISSSTSYKSEIVEVKTCAFCQEKESKFRCSKCKTTKYCSKECQIKDWPMHRPICHMLK